MSAARPRLDAIVVGVGSMGSAALLQLARRGKRVLGLEQFGLAHQRGSMHGQTRIIRLAYHEDPGYVPLLRRSYELWRELEQASGLELLRLNGCLELGPPDGPLVTGTLRACREHGLAHEVLEPDELRRRLPMFDPHPDAVGVLQPEAGFVRSEPAVQAQGELAVAAGAELRLGERVLDWSATASGVTVRTDAATYEADRLVLAPGAWASDLLRLPHPLLTTERQVVAWFEPAAEGLFEPDGMPVFIVEEDGVHHYGFPRVDGAGVKLGRMHHPGGEVDPDSDAPPPQLSEVEPLREFLSRRLPRAAGALLDAQACIFTNTPDKAFVIDLHPSEPNVVVASVCSGHGFKFAPVVGEVLADLAEHGSTAHPVDFLRLERFLPASAAGP